MKAKVIATSKREGLKIVTELTKKENTDTFFDTEKVKCHLFLKQTWNATLTVNNILYIEVIRGQMLNKKKWDEVKGMAKLPSQLIDCLEGFYSRDWSKFN